MEARSAIVIVLDRMGAGYLGPYGNTWLDTPAWNRLAGESWLMEFVQSDSPDLNVAYRSLWKGCHALCDRELEPSTTLAKQLGDWGLETILVTDEPRVATDRLAGDFAKIVSVPTADVDRAAEEAEQTQLAKVFSAALEELQDRPKPFLLWLHARAMEGAWDAPTELRERFLEEGDPPPPTFVAPPDKICQRQDDPDELWGLVHAYSGQVALLDLCLGAFLDELAERPTDLAPLLLVTSPRGFPLGEHGRVGVSHFALHEELLHVPALLRFPDGRAALRRELSLLQLPDLQATLMDWFAGDRARPDTWGRSLDVTTCRGLEEVADRAGSSWETERSFRTPAWYLRQDSDDPPALYAKPDDRREINEVANRARQETEAMLAGCDEFFRAAGKNRRDELTPLPDLIRTHRP